MKVNVWLMCKYYITAMIVNHHFCKDQGLSVLLLSHFENAVKMAHIRHKLGSFQAETNVPVTMRLPTVAQIQICMRSKYFESGDYDISMITDALYFYFQVQDSRSQDSDQIASDPSAMYRVPLVVASSSEDGRKIDRFGMTSVHLKSVEFAANQIVHQNEITSEVFVQNMINDFFVKTITNFVVFRTEIKFENRKHAITADQNGELSAADIEIIGRYIVYLKDASKDKLKERGYNTESFLFKDHNEVELIGFEPKMPEGEESLFKMYDEFLQHELEFKNDFQGPPKYLIEVERIEEAEVEELIDNELDNKLDNEIEGSIVTEPVIETLSGKLNKIDNHAFSAKSIAARNRERGVEYGTEKAKYPANLVKILIQKDKSTLFEHLMTNYEHGMRSVFAIDTENIFRAAYSKYRQGDAHFFQELIKYKFELTPDQKKLLFRHILKTDNVALFEELVVRNNVIDLFEYQKERGISFFQSLLIEADEHQEIFKRINLGNAKINQKIRFIPEKLPTETEALEDDDLYWRPSYNNLNHKINGVVIKKGWDNLTIAAAMKNHEMFDKLLHGGADTTMCKMVLPHIKHDRMRAMIIILDGYSLMSRVNPVAPELTEMS